MGTNPSNEYGLRGPQVQPDASYWLLCPAPCTPSLKDILNLTDDPANKSCFFPPFPDEATTALEIAELKRLACLRDDPEALFNENAEPPQRGLSMFLRLRQQPLGAVVNAINRKGLVKSQ